jgi:hypothetical protein
VSISAVLLPETATEAPLTDIPPQRLDPKGAVCSIYRDNCAAVELVSIHPTNTGAAQYQWTLLSIKLISHLKIISPLFMWSRVRSRRYEVIAAKIHPESQEIGQERDPSVLIVPAGPMLRRPQEM